MPFGMKHSRSKVREILLPTSLQLNLALASTHWRCIAPTDCDPDSANRRRAPTVPPASRMDCCWYQVSRSDQTRKCHTLYEALFRCSWTSSSVIKTRVQTAPWSIFTINNAHLWDFPIFILFYFKLIMMSAPPTFTEAMCDKVTNNRKLSKWGKQEVPDIKGNIDEESKRATKKTKKTAFPWGAGNVGTAGLHTRSCAKFAPICLQSSGIQMFPRSNCSMPAPRCLGYAMWITSKLIQWPLQGSIIKLTLV